MKMIIICQVFISMCYGFITTLVIDMILYPKW